MQELESEIKAAIEKSLPLQVGEALKKRLEKADKDAMEYERYLKAHSEKVEQISKLEKIIIELKTEIRCQDELMKLSDEVKEQKRNQKVFEAELHAKFLEGTLERVTDIVKLVFRSPVYKSYISKNDYTNADYQTRYKTGESIEEIKSEE